MSMGFSDGGVDARDQCLDRRQYAFHDRVDPAAVRVHAVLEVEIGLCRDAFKEEGIEEDVVLCRELGKDRVEGGGIVIAEIRGRAHSGEEDRQPAGRQSGEDRIERLARDRRIGAPESVVGAELDDDCVGLGPDRPVEAGEAVARGISRNAGIDDGHIVAARPEGALELDGEGLVSGEAEARSQAVAEGDDRQRGRRGRRAQKRGKQGQGGNQTRS